MSLFDRQHPQNNIGTGNIIVWDMSLLYYPWGDSRWRPFVLVGTGIQQLDSYGSASPIYSGTLFEIPFGVGLKYRFNEWLTWRVDVIDNFAHSAPAASTRCTTCHSPPAWNTTSAATAERTGRGTRIRSISHLAWGQYRRGLVPVPFSEAVLSPGS